MAADGRKSKWFGKFLAESKKRKRAESSVEKKEAFNVALAEWFSSNSLNYRALVNQQAQLLSLRRKPGDSKVMSDDYVNMLLSLVYSPVRGVNNLRKLFGCGYAMVSKALMFVSKLFVVAVIRFDSSRDFVISLIDKITEPENTNPSGHRINVHWFNDITSPIQPDLTDRGPFGNTHREKGNNKRFNPNNRGTFSKTTAEISDLIYKLKAVQYRGMVRDGASDLPQVYETALRAFNDQGVATKKMLIMITDAETHHGEGCPKEKKRAEVELDLHRVFGNEIGFCPADDRNANHVCRRTCPCKKKTCKDKCQVSCSLGKCMCGLWKSALFKEANPDIPLSIVAIPNLNWDDAYTGFKKATFQAQAEYMATRGRLFVASDGYASLNSLVEPLTENLCD